MALACDIRVASDNAKERSKIWKNLKLKLLRKYFILVFLVTLTSLHKWTRQLVQLFFPIFSPNASKGKVGKHLHCLKGWRYNGRDIKDAELNQHYLCKLC